MNNILRDSKNRPYIAFKQEPLNFAGGKTPNKLLNGKAYGRISSFASDIGDKEKLVKWTNRNILKGLVLNDDYYGLASALVASEAPNYEIDNLINELKIKVSANYSSNLGTSWHIFTELIDENIEVEHYRKFNESLKNYVNATAEMKNLESEVFVVNDDLELAGTFDCLNELENGETVISDKKTGTSTNRFPLSTIIQVSIYANSLRYNQTTGERTLIHPNLNKDKGFLIHAPIRESSQVQIYELNLKLGYEIAKLHHQENKLSNQLLKEFKVKNVRF